MRPGLLGAVASLVLFFQLGVAQSKTSGSAILDQLTKELPPCALQCTLTEVPKSTCALTDFTCICTNQDLTNDLLACLSQGCTVVEQLQTQKLVKNACSAPVRNAGHRLTALTWAFFGAAIFAVGCRFVARLAYFGGNFAWDDYTIAICLLSLVPIAVIAQMMINNGLGQDIWELSPHQISNTLFYFYIEEFLYIFLSAVTKVSILLLYLQIFRPKAFQIQCYVLIALIVGYSIAGFLSTGLSCRPLNYLWNGWDGQHPGKCMNINAQTFAMAGINMSLDIVIFILPIPLIFGLHMKMGKRLGVIAIFATGLFVTVCSVVRLTTLLKWGKSQNPTYDYTEVAAWSLIELMTGVICACMPGIASLVRRIFPKAFGTTHAKSYLSSDKKSGNFNSKLSTPIDIQSKAIASSSYTAKITGPADASSTRSDELELTPSTAFQHYNKYTRYSEES